MTEKSDRRSHCPISCTLDLIGDKWTLLVLRDAWLGATRFKDFQASPENIPSNLLTERLERLVGAGLLEKKPLAEGGARSGYHLTEKGRSLGPVLRAIKDWGLANLPGTRAAKLE